MDRQTDRQIMIFNGVYSSLLGDGGCTPFLVLETLGKLFDECGMRTKRDEEF